MVLDTLADGQERYGSEIARMTGLRTASVYSMLRRLHDRGYILDRWTDTPKGTQGPQKRRYWRLNPDNPAPSEVDDLRQENLRLKARLREKTASQLAVESQFQMLVDEVRKGLSAMVNND
jgi:transcription initiation factor IIE alpha subunit